MQSNEQTHGKVVMSEDKRLCLEAPDGELYALHQYTDVENKKLTVGMEISGILFCYEKGGGYVQPGTVRVKKQKALPEQITTPFAKPK